LADRHDPEHACSVAGARIPERWNAGPPSEVGKRAERNRLDPNVPSGDHRCAAEKGDFSLVRWKWKIGAATAALIVIACGALWYFESPAWTLKGMRDAARSRDADALNAYIDYPALRESLRADLMAGMTTETRKDKSGFGPLGTAFGSAVLDPMIDGLVSPAGIRAALIGSRQETTGTVSSALPVPKQPVIVRRNFSEFIVTTKDQPDGGLVFRRHGLSWKLSGVELPPDRSSRSPARSANPVRTLAHRGLSDRARVVQTLHRPALG